MNTRKQKNLIPSHLVIFISYLVFSIKLPSKTIYLKLQIKILKTNKKQILL